MAQSKQSTPTLEDVARHANVSTATVSRCLNAPERVVEATRKRVLAAVRELSYSPNFGARALAAKRTNTVGAIIPTMENAIFARGIQAFQEELRQSGVTLLIASSSYRAEIEEEQIRSLTARGADGLLLIGHDRNPEIYQFLEMHRVPVLVCWSFDPDPNPPSIGFDNRVAMRKLASEVTRLGHQRIGVISAKRENNDRARNRVLGIVDAMVAAGLDPASMDLVETPYGIGSGGEAFEEIMKCDPRPTVVICGNDVLAVGAVRRARQMGLRVPRDVSITGFDDIELAQVSVPELTTVRVPHRAMGREAARMLVEMVAGQPPEESVELQVELQIRDTLAEPFG